ncbi:prepilin-type N-terminal cleavage/methylation domain-containing protein [Massilia sp. CFBP9026]|uniref:prepilin-type N-terminal cleavage/methylation domain-containing protein n=1 Tax=Massilia sp. CFBP9026 TaxID=3096536 RepID=UPI002A69C4F4|nr:prepilin-type N-terminal cleavage/methylation domain-containing protein [Massilia sp. CFBP9026]MDY0965232.1 prepilin-type N-terminal cleavage/methylation domain-containing protein [Massilia sp. CFBP9026]
MAASNTMRRLPARGFTLVELIVVIVLIGIIGGVLVLQLLPAIRSYLLVGQRAALTNQADTALRKIVGEVRSAVPNSLRLGSSTCMELVPTKDGGRYRMGPHIDGNTVAGDFLDDTEARSRFDVLTEATNTPVQGDAIVIGNQNTDDVYKQVNVGIVNASGAPTNAATGVSSITLDAAIQIPPGYDGGRFVVVPKDEKVVTYLCTGAGKLYRLADAAFHPEPTCPSEAPAGAALVADKVSHCAFIYSPNQGATQESGFIQLQLTLSDKGESVPLIIGAHVDNVP